MRLQDKSAISYLLRNFFKLFAIAIVPAVLMGLYFNSAGQAQLLFDAFSGELTEANAFDKIIDALTVSRYASTWWQSLLALLVFIFAESVLCVYVGRHMRIGVSNLWHSVKSAIPFLLRMALFTVVFYAFSQVVDLLIVGLMYLFNLSSNVVLLNLVLYVMIIASDFLISLCFALTLCSFPVSYMEGYPINVALSYSVRTTSSNPSFIWSFALIYVAVRFGVLVFATLLAGIGLSSVVYVLYFLFWIMYVPVVAFATYFDFTNGERRDLTQVMFAEDRK